MFETSMFRDQKQRNRNREADNAARSETRASAEKFSRGRKGRWQLNKDRKIAIKTRKIAKRPKNSTIKTLPGGGRREGITEKRPKIAKNTPKNSTTKPLSTIIVPRIKIQEKPRPRCRRPCSETPKPKPKPCSLV